LLRKKRGEKRLELGRGAGSSPFKKKEKKGYAGDKKGGNLGRKRSLSLEQRGASAGKEEGPKLGRRSPKKKDTLSVTSRGSSFAGGEKVHGGHSEIRRRAS